MNHQTFIKINMIDAIEGHVVDEAHVYRLLQQERCELSSQGEFVGKPSTYLCVDAHWALKLHDELNVSEKVIQRWVEKRLQMEREVGLYHPQRSWFVLEKQTGGWCAGNISPRMVPLHQLISDEKSDAEQSLHFLKKVTYDYIAYAAQAEKRLDEGLSNFGMIDGDIYYLDDDIYEWDNFTSLSALLASWIRQYAELWLNASVALQLGKHISQTMHLVYPNNGSLDAPLSMVEHLRVMFFSADVKASLEGLLQGLRYQEGAIAVVQKRKRLALEDFEKFFFQDELIGITSDIHANLPALNTVLDTMHGLGVKHILDLGDIVGYGPFPVECIQRLRDVGTTNIRGNHDHMIGNGAVSPAANAVSTWTAMWTMDQLNHELNTWLHALPLRLLAKPWMAVHGSPQDKTCFNAYVYSRTAERNLHWMIENGYRFCLHGHSHIPGIFALKAGQLVMIQDQTEVDLNEFDAALICPGSVGQPRGGIVGTQFATLDPKALGVSFYHLDYDLEVTVQKMQQYGFPDKAMSRLRNGI